jgi:hypothetical protein
MRGRLFTVEEANALLPTLIPLVERLLAARERVVASSAELERVLEKSPGNGGSKRASEAVVDLAIVEEIAAKVGALGCELKDLNLGLVDFPARHPEGEGRVAYLCWRYGEDEVEWWHETDAGFEGRKRL